MAPIWGLGTQAIRQQRLILPLHKCHYYRAIYNKVMLLSSTHSFSSSCDETSAQITSQPTAALVQKPNPQISCLPRHKTVAQGQMTANAFPRIQIEELTVKAAAAIAKCAEGVRDLPYERWKLPGVKICKDKERVLSITKAMRNFVSKNWKVKCSRGCIVDTTANCFHRWTTTTILLES